MKLLVKRELKKDTYTIGKMYVDGKYFCDTLEDKDRGLKQSDAVSSVQKIKVQHQTAIPVGIYEVIVNKSPRFGRMLPRILNIPGFDGVLIHRGNTDKDTSGCILVGEYKGGDRIINSTPYETKLVALLTEVQNKKEPIEIEIQ